MKNIILSILVLSVFFSCSNDDESLNDNLVGNWNWKSSSGGIAGITETPETTGNTINLEITKDSIFNYLNGTLSGKTAYTIETKESLLFNEMSDMIIRENGFRQIINISKDQLILVGDCYDCFSSEYVKE
ncbi:hypothetical protein [Lutibacter citreus]|uniref:hypothetical protein n=1 Tax=Lutibacter citreus TaxID=2138210 RepID=UPI000DBE73C5|nr:hypothetical protein [Lutibacter citreus]